MGCLMRSIIVTMLSIVIVIAAMSLPVYAEGTTYTYVGAATCKMCHKGEAKSMVYEKWEKSGHANATAVLKDQKDVSDKCYKCHATGFGAATGYKAGSEAGEKLAGVQCEACHGPGSDYKKMNVMKDKNLSAAAGLIMPKPEACAACHNNSHHKDLKFDYKTAWPKIEHKITK